MKTSNELLPCREAFENFVKSGTAANDPNFLEKDSKGNYLLNVTKGGWAAWQGALMWKDRTTPPKVNSNELVENQSLLSEIAVTLEIYAEDYLHVFKNYILKEHPVHEGDCTKVAHTCMICFINDEIKSMNELSNKLKQALQNAAVVSEWLDISSAPKDGTQILTAFKGDEIPVWWQQTTFWNSEGRWDGIQVEPTHWQPIPLSPKESL